MKKPELTPEEQAYVQRITASRLIGNDVLNLLAHMNTPPDVVSIAGFTLLMQGLVATHKINPDVAQGLVDEFAREFAAVVSKLGLVIDAPEGAETSEAPSTAAGHA